MNINVRKGDVTEEKCDLLVVNCFEGVKKPEGATGAVDEALGGKLSRYWAADKFTGKLGTSFMMHIDGDLPAARVLVVGLGKKEAFTTEAVRQAAAVSMNTAVALAAKSVVSVLHGAGEGELTPRGCARAMAEGVRLASYKFSKYKKDKSKSPKRFDIVSTDGRAVRPAVNGVEDGEIGAMGANFARDLVNTPGHEMHPEVLVDTAREIVKGKGTLKIKVYNREKLEKMGAGGILGVAKGSDFPPYMVHMIYKPAKPTKKKVALVGKAVTFDSGGLSLKPSGSMETMKVDMAGSAAVLGAFSVIDRLSPKVEVHGIFGAVENMPSGRAVRPGDVLQAMNKKTIEVLNTDAEGRLTLADTLSYAVKQKPDAIVDLATLTGACVVALGEEISGVMGNNDKLAKQVLEAAAAAGEKMWELPLEKNYRKLIDSDIADIKNIGSRWGGSLTAGLFLQEFVDDTPWVHLDIAGPAYAERPIDPYTKKGATGHAVRTLLEYLRSF